MTGEQEHALVEVTGDAVGELRAPHAVRRDRQEAERDAEEAGRKARSMLREQLADDAGRLLRERQRTASSAAGEGAGEQQAGRRWRNR